MKRTRKRDKKTLIEWLKGLSKPKKAALIIGTIFLLFLVLVVFYVASKFSKLDTQKIAEEDFGINEEIEALMTETDFGTGYSNFVLFGGDSRTGEVDRNLNTDVVMIVSLNNETKEIKLVSVYRDTLLEVKDGSIQKCNSAYSGGGPARAINMLNKNLDLNIKRYVTVDFGAVAEVIDMLGGIEVEISEKEMKAMNKYIKETARVAGKEAVLIEEPGYQHVDGVQATTYARIRKGVGDDYQRTERQRLVIKLVLEKVLQSDWATINNIIDEVLPTISTNFTMSEILMYAKNFAYYEIADSSGFPFNKDSKTIPGRGSSVYTLSLKDDVKELHQFLFGTEDYQPSSTVVDISSRIYNLVNRSGSSGGGSSLGGSSSGGSSSGGSSTGTTTDPGTGNEGTGTTDPGTGNEETGTTDPGTGNEGTGTTTPGAGNEGTGTTNPGTGNEGTGTTDPGTGNEGTGTTTPGTGTTTPNMGTTTPGSETGASVE